MNNVLLTPEQLAEIEKREQAATKGPWKVITDKHPHKHNGDHTERRIFTQWDHPQLKGPLGVVNIAFGIGKEQPVQFVHIDDGNAEFIAASRTDIPALLSHIRARDDERVILRLKLHEIARRIHHTDDCPLWGGNGYCDKCAIQSTLSEKEGV